MPRKQKGIKKLKNNCLNLLVNQCTHLIHMSNLKVLVMILEGIILATFFSIFHDRYWFQKSINCSV